MAETAKPLDMAAVTQTPEFQKAVAEAASKAAIAAVAEISKGAGAMPTADLRDFFSQMAMSIADISDQGTQRKRVAPEILAQRAKALTRCHELLSEARASGLKPEYAVMAKVYFNERLIEPFRRDVDKKVPVRQEIVWTGMPNDALRPLNDIAKAIFAAYKESIGSVEKIPSLDNRPVWVTPGGLVVKGDAPAKAFVANPNEFSDDLAIVDNNDPRAPEVAILGTIAPKARRNQSDYPQARA